MLFPHGLADIADKLLACFPGNDAMDGNPPIGVFRALMN